MTTQEILKKVKQIEILSLRKTNSYFLGEYHSSFKGSGMTFSEIRPYQYGDDVRKIDWNNTARFNEPYVKIFEEEREQTLFLMVDITASMNFGTLQQSKRETVAELCATLAFSAIKNNDKVGLILFSDTIDLYVPPKKGKKHVLRIIREIIEFQPKSSPTNLEHLIEYFLNISKRKSIAFIISDFDEIPNPKKLNVLARKHDITSIRVFDNKEKSIPNIGFVRVRDLETGKMKWVNSSSSKVRKEYKKYYQNHEKQLKDRFHSSGAGFINLQSEDDYTRALLKFFKSHHKN